MDENALSTARLKQLLAEGLQALETKFFAYQGEVVEKKEVIPWEIRRKYLELALKVKGMLAPEKFEISGKDSGTIQTSDLSDDERKQLKDLARTVAAQETSK